MVGPSLTDEEQETQRRRLKLGIVATVGASGGLVALANGGSPTIVAVATVAALLVGAVLVWYLSAIAPDSGL